MKIHVLEKSYVNISGKIYDSEFINLAKIKDDKIAIDERTLFLNKTEKNLLNAQEIKKFDRAIYMFRNRSIYGIVCDIPINEYEMGNIKCHELVMPDIIQGMLSNLHGYNCEASPVLLAHEKKIDYASYIDEQRYVDSFLLGDMEIYVYNGIEAQRIAEEFIDVESLYVADGHHRLYTTSLSNFKTSVLSCLISFDFLDILPIHRIIPNIDTQLFERAKDFIFNRFEIQSSETMLTKGKILMNYGGDSFVVNLIDLNSDAFWNNDIYRLNTQIISQAFRIFDTSKLEYISEFELKNEDITLENNTVLIKTYPVEKNEFIQLANKNSIMPPKSTWFAPKFPSFLILKQYK